MCKEGARGHSRRGYVLNALVCCKPFRPSLDSDVDKIQKTYDPVLICEDSATSCYFGDEGADYRGVVFIDPCVVSDVSA